MKIACFSTREEKKKRKTHYVLEQFPVCAVPKDLLMDCWELLLPMPGPAAAFLKRYLHCHSPFIITVDLIEMMRPSFLQYHVTMTHSAQLFSLMKTGSFGIKDAFQLEVCVTSSLIFPQKECTFIYPPPL